MSEEPTFIVDVDAPLTCGGPGIFRQPINLAGTSQPATGSGCQCCRREIDSLESRLNSELEFLRREISGLRGCGSSGGIQTIASTQYCSGH